MAEAVRHEAVTETKVVEVEPVKVVLTLTFEEAQFLRTLLGSHVLQQGPARRVSDGIFHALHPHVARDPDILLSGSVRCVRARADEVW